MAFGTRSIVASSGIFRNSSSEHVVGFSDYIGNGNALCFEFIIGMILVEITSKNIWSHFLLESDCLLVILSISNHNLVS